MNTCSRFLFLALISVIALPAFYAAEFITPGDKMFAAYFKAETDRLAASCLADIKTLDDWNSRKDKYRSQMHEMLGLDPMPETFWERSMFTKPEGKDVVCHASAWDVDLTNDQRIKMCIQPTLDELVTIHHELGHNYYNQYYTTLPVLFQNSAHDGFHEAIGDAVALSITPGYLQNMGLIEEAEETPEAVLNKQMLDALQKVAFLPFGWLFSDTAYRDILGTIWFQQGYLYSLVYTLVLIGFGWQALLRWTGIARRPTYQKWRYISLIGFQVVFFLIVNVVAVQALSIQHSWRARGLYAPWPLFFNTFHWWSESDPRALVWLFAGAGALGSREDVGGAPGPGHVHDAGPERVFSRG